MRKPDIVFMASRDWDSLPLHSHYLAEGFARLGHEVLYINQTLQKWPRLSHVLWRLLPHRKSGRVSSYSREHAVPNVTPVTIWTGPPTSWLRPINKRIIAHTLKAWRNRRPIFVTFVPTYTALDLADFLKPGAIAYVNYHHFEADNVISDLLRAERELVDRCDFLFADSLFLRERITRMSGGREVHRCMPGVYYDRFRAACRGDEVTRRRTIYYFGDIGAHLDLDLYNGLAETHEVTFIGVVNPVARELISSRIRVLPPVSVMDLPSALREADIVTALYRPSEYMLGVIPAKFFECLATGKPFLVSGLREAEPYRELVYIVQDGLTEALRIIEDLSTTESPERRAACDDEARTADWGKRFEQFKTVVLPGENDA